MKKRESNFDLLRILSCIAMIMIHVSARYYIALTNPDVFGEKYFNYNFYIVVFNTISRFAVPCFVMLSGAFLLSDPKNKDRKYFYKKSIKSILIPVIIFSIGYFIFFENSMIHQIINHNGSKELLFEPIKRFIYGAPYYHMWYMYMLIGLYLIVPDIIKYQENMNEKTRKKVTLFIFVICAISGVMTKTYINYGIAKVVLYIGYLLMGYEIKQKVKNKNNLKAILFITSGLLTELLLSRFVYKYQIGTDLNDMEYIKNILFGIDNFHPFVVISSILIFTGFGYLKTNIDLSKIANKTYYIYLFHAVVLFFTEKLAIRTFGINIDARIAIPIEILIVFIISYILTNIYLWIYKKINKNEFIENKLYKLFNL